MTETSIKEIAYDHTYNMNNYIVYHDAEKVLKVLSKLHKLGIISDTWPSIEQQLCSFGVADYFSTCTYSCFVGTFKPDERMYKDALDDSFFVGITKLIVEIILWITLKTLMAWQMIT